MADYLLSPAAEQDMEDIFDYTIEHWGLTQAIFYTDHLMTTFEKLSNSPSIAKDCGYIRKDYFRYHVKHHFIYFQYDSFNITIIRILHERMNPILHL